MERRKIETGRGMMMRCRIWQQDRFLSDLAPYVSVKDRSLSGPANRV